MEMMVLFITAIFVLLWAVVGLIIANKAFQVLRINMVCDVLSSRIEIKPEWRPFMRFVSSSVPTESRTSMLLRALILGPPRIAACIALVGCAGFSALVLPEAWVAFVARAVSRSILKCVGLRLKVTGYRAPFNAAPCIVANHVSATDILVLLSLGASFVANHNVLSIPGIGWVAKSIGCIFVARDSQDSRLAAKNAIQSKLLLSKSSFNRNTCESPLVVFPEGTTTNGKGLLVFRRGAFESGANVQPARIVYSNKQCSMSLLDLGELLCFLCVIPASNVVVHFLPPVAARRESESGPAEMAEECRSKIASVRGEPLLELFDAGSHRDEKSLTNYILNSAIIA